MQSEATKVTQKSSSPNRSPDTSSASHHGLHQPEQCAISSPHRVELEGEHGRSAWADEAASVHAAGRSRSTDASIARLRSVSPPQPRSPGERIAEHERASKYLTKKRIEGPAFTVVHRRKKSGSDQSTINEFPNGWPPDITKRVRANNNRGPHSYTLSPSSALLIGCLACVASFPRLGHHAARLANGIFAFLPRS